MSELCIVINELQLIKLLINFDQLCHLILTWENHLVLTTMMCCVFSFQPQLTELIVYG